MIEIALPNRETCVETNKASKKLLFSGAIYLRFFIGDDNGLVEILRTARGCISATDSPISPLEPSVLRLGGNLE